MLSAIGICHFAACKMGGSYSVFCLKIDAGLSDHFIVVEEAENNKRISACKMIEQVFVGLAVIQITVIKKAAVMLRIGKTFVKIPECLPVRARDFADGHLGEAVKSVIHGQSIP